MNIRFYPGVQNFGIDTTFMLGTFKPVLLSEWQTSWVDSIHFSELRAASAEGLLTFQTSKNPALHEKTGFQYHLPKKLFGLLCPSWPSASVFIGYFVIGYWDTSEGMTIY